LKPLLGSTADVGQYKRMAIGPIPALKQLEGGLTALHFLTSTMGYPENLLRKFSSKSRAFD